ncbi:MAG: excinuclease ABC subunit B [Chloroflexi bacterium]|nr:excinuclease ABC subunit B [Chloroflexota bacterium]|tara:strand:+ start:38172 stop:40178 length:2007 start_codon:yes stop_codon:yes gene_type:complete
MPNFKIKSDFHPTGDQPDAILRLVSGLNNNLKEQILLGATGSGKTFTMACVIEKVQKPTLVLVHNKTLAAQLATEFKEYFPKNAVEYFVSYYDYYQPEAYVPSTDTFIEKDADINEILDKLRHAATRSLLTRRDTIIVASVSCIFGLGSPEEYQNFMISIQKGDIKTRKSLTKQLIDMQYERNDFDFLRGRFRIRGDTLEVFPAYEEEIAFRLEFWGDEVERIVSISPLTGNVIEDLEFVDIFPAKHFVTPQEKLFNAFNYIEDELVQTVNGFEKEGKLIEAQRIESRTNFDLEMLRETGYCSGIENYSRYLDGREPGSTPYTLLDYFEDDYLLFVDESHITLPQVRAMYGGDQSRKHTLVNFGFRLPSALDNRPLNFDEFKERLNQVIYVSATPSNYEYENNEQLVEQIIRPTGIIDPKINIRPSKGQIDDLINEIKLRIDKKERCLVTTLTKRMAEELSEYLQEINIKNHYLHSEIDTLDRSAILRDLRLGVYDVVVGINLLREGLDLPEVSLVAILDADKEGYLRSSTSLIQTIGRAARHVNGEVLMYADKKTLSMKKAIDETYRRREIQSEYNKRNNIDPKSILKNIRDINEDIIDKISVKNYKNDAQNTEEINYSDLSQKQINILIKNLKKDMKEAAKTLEFEKAALIRDKISDLRNSISQIY